MYVCMCLSPRVEQLERSGGGRGPFSLVPRVKAWREETAELARCKASRGVGGGGGETVLRVFK